MSVRITNIKELKKRVIERLDDIPDRIAIEKMIDEFEASVREELETHKDHTYTPTLRHYGSLCPICCSIYELRRVLGREGEK